MRTLIFLAALTILAGVTGCNGMVDTWQERQNTYAQAFDTDMRQIADDWDLLWLADRQYRLTRWHIK